jgi:hypothetical protein
MPGLSELDQATELHLKVRTLKDLEKVIELCESAIREGTRRRTTVVSPDTWRPLVYTSVDRASLDRSWNVSDAPIHGGQSSAKLPWAISKKLSIIIRTWAKPIS